MLSLLLGLDFSQRAFHPSASPILAI
uniref:Uncharacterized protein n=1 Tax=Anguilla anguilla TaxID=7936 RepID=A0A0E9VQE8_ANGAN